MKTYLVGLMMILGIASAYADQAIEQSHQEFYTQVCQRFIACGDHPHVAEMASLAHVKDVESCIAIMTRRDNAQQWRTLFDEERITYNPEKKSECFAQLSTLSCKTIANGIQKPSAIDGCARFIDGSVAIDALCSTQMECKAAGTVCSGTCQKPPLLECGDERCTGGQACDSKTLQCIAPRKVGESCTNFSECETSSCTGEGKCGALATVSKPGGSCEGGFVCSIGEECEGKICRPY